MKGIILAGGSGTRLYPLTLAVTKQLLPVYNKPMIYYPLAVLMQAGIEEILIISRPEDQSSFQRLLGDGSQFGLELQFATQSSPNGIAEAFLIAESFIGKSNVCLVLGDNIFYGDGLKKLLLQAKEQKNGATLFAYEVKDPSRYGVFEFNKQGKAISICEKPTRPKSNLAVTGLYFYDNQVVEIAKSLKPSSRGELEITDVNQNYLKRGLATVHVMGQGFAWLDAGTFESLMQASQFVQVIEDRQGHLVSSVEEIALDRGLIDLNSFTQLALQLGDCAYANHLLNVAKKKAGGHENF